MTDDTAVLLALLIGAVLVLGAAAAGFVHDRDRRSVRLLDREAHRRGAQMFRYYTDVNDSSNA